MSQVRTRFAPSPTGYLHVGGARTALFNWLYARHHGGTFVLRVEDTDEARNTEEARTAIFDGLRWLGLDWDEGPEAGGDFGPYFQSERREIYDRHFARLEDAGVIYDDNDAKRFRLDGGSVAFKDEICGDVAFDLDQEPDLTLKRPDGSYIFHFVNVIDDLEMGMTHVIRGEDHLPNTPKHIRIFEALGVTPPTYAHIPLILNQDGSKMSKRDQGAAIGSYVDNGFLPEAVVNFLSLLGWSPKDDSEKLPLQEIIDRFGLDAINRSPAKFDLEKCTWLNQQYLGELNDDTFQEKAAAHAPADLPPGALILAKGKVRKFDEIGDYLAPAFDDEHPTEDGVRQKVTKKPENKNLLLALAKTLDGVEAWTVDAIKAAVQATAETSGVKMGALMFPLRATSTGMATGPDLVPLLALLGKERTLARVRRRIGEIFE
ncbi:MAG: glutamate--tRNA ligase family protein [Verrucomicrobiota bacterium]